MSRDYKLYLDDILDAIKKIEDYTEGIPQIEFNKDNMIIDAVIRNLEVIGEAVKNLPRNIREKYPDLEWKKIAGMRDILIHEYFGVNLEIVWDIVTNKIPKLKNSVKEIMEELNSNEKSKDSTNKNKSH